jgi:translation initiation factor IF-3
MEVSGKIKWLDETKTYGNNGFRKREVVVTTEEQFPQHILVEFIQDKCDLLNAFQMGQNVKIGINLRGREWINPQGETKYFNSVQGWRIEALEASSNSEMPPMPPPPAFESADDATDGPDDDLPF